MTKEMKYGILALIGLLIIIPICFIAIKAIVGTLYLIFNYPAYVLTFIGGTFIGGYLNTKLK